MIVVRLIKRGILVVAIVGLLVGATGAASAYANSPWWHLTSGAEPSDLHSGVGKSEVQKLTVSATGGSYLLIDPTPFKFAFVPYNLSAAELQTTLEGIYGAGTVNVSGGPGDENGTLPYTLTFTGGLADQYVAPLEALNGTLAGGVSLTEVTKGSPDGKIIVTVADLGDANVEAGGNPVTIVDKLPSGLRAVGIEGESGEHAFGTNPGPVECDLKSLSCTFAGNLPAYDSIRIEISVVVEPNAQSGELNEAGVSGGGASSMTIKRPVTLGNLTPFGVQAYELTPEEEGGGPATQAGSHPFQLTTTLMLNQTSTGEPVALTKDLHFKLPPGLIGNPDPFEKCTLSQFYKITAATVQKGNECPEGSVLGVARITYVLASGSPGKQPLVITQASPLFNLEPATGEPARFGFELPGTPVVLDTSVRTGGDYGVTVDVPHITQTASFIANEVTFWGVPGDPRHDPARGFGCLVGSKNVGYPPCPALGQSNPPPFLQMPTSCTGPLQTTVEAESWLQAGEFQSFGTAEPLPAMDGCNRLQFHPTISVAPDGEAASTPTGLKVAIHVPQDVSLDAGGLAEAQVKNTTVTLPEGVAINPAGADGLEACNEEQIALKVDADAKCPEASKIGLVKIETPLLPNELEGAAYLAEQNANPFGSLVAIYIIAEDPVSGTLVKLAGEVVLNPVTGQLVSTFKNTPQLPFETFELHFFGGARAPLATPSKCGAYTTTASIEPWTETGEVSSNSTFDIASAPNGAPCTNPLPFNPSFTGGATNINASAFSPLTLTMTRKDGEQNLSSVEAHLPPGLSGILSNVELCREPQANLGECGPNSQIGEATVSVGVGGDPFTVSGGKFYLTGPYNGSDGCTVGSPGCAPFGITFEVPAKAGPFDLKRNTANPAAEDPCDCVIVRGKIEVDPITAAVTIVTDPPGSPYAIPTSIEGIPLEIQHVNAVTTRSDFQFNPTNCNKMELTGTIHSSENATRNVSAPFQVTNCAVLAFKPGFTVSTSGKTSRKKGASLHVKLTYPKAPFGSQANIKSVKVDLPKQLPSRLTTLQKACTAAQFESNPGGCPADSIVGHATAITPLVPVALTGPAYFVSYGGAKFPELVIVLQGYGVTLDLHGETFINKAGITSSTFKTIPDAPVGSFELTLPEGEFSALAANGNLCKSKLTMPTLFTAQNGAVIKQSTPIGVTGCAKAKTKKKGAAHKPKRGRGKGKK